MPSEPERPARPVRTASSAQSAPGKDPPDASWLPRQRRGTTPQMIGRYPDFDVFDAADTWDEATTKVVVARLHLDGPFRFFPAPGGPDAAGLL